MSTSSGMKTLAFHPTAQGKSGRMPELSVKQAAWLSRKGSKKAMPGGGPAAASVLSGARSVADSCTCRMAPGQVNPFLSSGHGQI